MRVGEVPMPEQRVERRHRGRQRARTARRIGEHGPSRRVSQRRDAVYGHTTTPAGDDHAALVVHGCDRVSIGHSDAGDGGAGKRCDTGLNRQGERVASGRRWELAGSADERLAERQVEVHGTETCGAAGAERE